MVKVKMGKEIHLHMWTIFTIWHRFFFGLWTVYLSPFVKAKRYWQNVFHIKWQNFLTFANEYIFHHFCHNRKNSFWTHCKHIAIVIVEQLKTECFFPLNLMLKLIRVGEYKMTVWLCIVNLAAIIKNAHYWDTENRNPG